MRIDWWGKGGRALHYGCDNRLLLAASKAALLWICGFVFDAVLDYISICILLDTVNTLRVLLNAVAFSICPSGLWNTEGALAVLRTGIRIHAVRTRRRVFVADSLFLFQLQLYPWLTTPSWTMTLKWIHLLCAATYLILPRTQATDDFKQRCLSFTPETYVHNSTRTVLEYVPAGTTLDFPDNDASCARPSQLVSMDMCRVALSIPTSNRYVRLTVLKVSELLIEML